MRLLALLALTLPTLASGVSIAGVRAAVGRQAGRTLPQRLGLDLALVVARRDRAAPAAAVRRAAHPQRPRRPRRGPAARRRAGDRPARRRGARDPASCPASRSSRSGCWPRTRGLVAVPRRPAARAPPAALHAGRAAAGARRGPRDVRVGARRDVDAQPGRPGGVDGRARTCGCRPGPRSERPGVGPRARRCGRSRGDRGDAGRRGDRRPRLDAPRRHARGGRRRRRWPTSSGCATTPRATRRSPRCAARRAGARRCPGLALPAGTRRVSLSSTRRSRPSRASRPIPQGYEGLTASVVVVDGDGRLARIDVTSRGPLGRRPGAQLVIALTVPGTAGALAGPVHLLGLDLEPVDRRPPERRSRRARSTVTGSWHEPRRRGRHVDARSTSHRPAAGGSTTRRGNRQPLDPGPGPRHRAARRVSCSRSRPLRWEMTVLPARDPAPTARRSWTRPSSTGPAPRSATRCTPSRVRGPGHARPGGARRRVPVASTVEAVRPRRRAVARPRPAPGPAARSSTRTSGGCRSTRAGPTRSPRPLAVGADQRRGRRRPTAVAADLAGDPLGLGRHRDPRASGRSRPSCSRRSASSSARRCRSRSGSASSRCSRRWASRRASCCCGSRSRTSRCWPRA